MGKREPIARFVAEDPFVHTRRPRNTVLNAILVVFVNMGSIDTVVSTAVVPVYAVIDAKEVGAKNVNLEHLFLRLCFLLRLFLLPPLPPLGTAARVEYET